MSRASYQGFTLSDAEADLCFADALALRVLTLASDGDDAALRALPLHDLDDAQSALSRCERNGCPAHEGCAVERIRIREAQDHVWEAGNV
jgi:hypothetical protein